MAVEFGDHASGFRHTEVIRFINNEVLMNGGGPDFYVAFRSRPWNEVEDRLQTVVADPQVPRAIKRACAWSALALGVRVAARQREQQARRIRRLQEQVDERETAAWALASELQRLREDREEAATQLRFTRAALQQALIECDVLRGRLHHAERSAQVIPLAPEIPPGPRAEQFGTIVWPLSAEQQRDVVAMGFPSRLYFEAQVPAPAAVLYMPGPPGPWAQAIQPPLPMPVPYPLPFHAPLPMGIPFLPPLPPAVVMDAEAAVVPLQMPPVGIYPPGACAVVGFQEVAPPWDQRSYSQEGGPEILQSTVSLGNTRNLSQDGLERPQGMVPVRDSWSQSQKEGPERAQETVPLGDSWTHNQGADQGTPQGMISLGDSWSQSQKEGPEKAQEMVPSGDSRSQSQKEGPEKAQEMVPFGDGWSQSQKEGPEKTQEMVPSGDGWSQSQKEGPEKAQEMVPSGDGWSQSQKEGPEKAQGMISSGDSWGQSQEGLDSPQGLAPLGDSCSLGQEDSERSQEMVTLVASQEEDPETRQEMVPLGASESHSQKDDPEGPQEVVPLGASGSQSQEEGPKNPQGMAPLGASRSNSQEEDPEGPQEMVSLGASGNHSKEEGPERPQSMAPLGDNSSQSQEEDLERPQGSSPPGDSRSDSREEGPQRPQATPVGDGWSQGMRENPKKQQPQGRKAKQPKGKKALDSQHQKSVSGCSPVNWDCPWCKAMNFSWRKACYKCKKVCVAGESRGLDPGQTH
ncbi:testis-expressed protein 13D [Ursus arctos]|uniref:testis-expressed protein 13D n=1 Tax=Ursus arctos TaxID=9644 RepID=UPI002017463C|nr:testis-expressed protein 13D [Ursus arctos]